ncbi:MAG: DUF4381 family protein [Verrucomicrobiota bacterium]|nr:DUF4381 family protein [Verrucomicrobiota bacterium]
MTFIAAQEFHDIAPPVDYSLIPTWLVFCSAFAVLALIGGIVWWIMRLRARRPVRVQSPRDRALEMLERIKGEIEERRPYEFSIAVSDILRRYVREQYQLPATRQTSVEFLNALSASAQFSTEDKTLLDHFLNRCDLIKFARYDATREDSRVLLEEATQFVRGGVLEPA